jgi:hypothetical protein
MIQSILVALIFAAALAYVVRLVVKSFESKSACSSGCGKCGAVDFEKISKRINENGF